MIYTDVAYEWSTLNFNLWNMLHVYTFIPSPEHPPLCDRGLGFLSLTASFTFKIDADVQGFAHTAMSFIHNDLWINKFQVPSATEADSL